MNLSTGGLGSTQLFTDYFPQGEKKENKHFKRKIISVTAVPMESNQPAYSLDTQLRGSYIFKYFQW